MIQKIYKGSDIMVALSLKDAEGTGIIAEEDTDYIALNALDLEKLEDGVLSYVYHIRVTNSNFKDGFYDEVIKGQTNLYLKSKCLCIK